MEITLLIYTHSHKIKINLKLCYIHRFKSKFMFIELFIKLSTYHIIIKNMGFYIL